MKAYSARIEPDLLKVSWQDSQLFNNLLRELERHEAELRHKCKTTELRERCALFNAIASMLHSSQPPARQHNQPQSPWVELERSEAQLRIKSKAEEMVHWRRLLNCFKDVQAATAAPPVPKSLCPPLHGQQPLAGQIQPIYVVRPVAQQPAAMPVHHSLDVEEMKGRTQISMEEVMGRSQLQSAHRKALPAKGAEVCLTAGPLGAVQRDPSTLSSVPINTKYDLPSVAAIARPTAHHPADALAYHSCQWLDLEQTKARTQLSMVEVMERMQMQSSQHKNVLLKTSENIGTALPQSACPGLPKVQNNAWAAAGHVQLPAPDVIDGGITQPAKPHLAVAMQQQRHRSVDVGEAQRRMQISMEEVVGRTQLQLACRKALKWLEAHGPQNDGSCKVPDAVPGVASAPAAIATRNGPMSLDEEEARCRMQILMEEVVGQTQLQTAHKKALLHRKCEVIAAAEKKGRTRVIAEEVTAWFIFVSDAKQRSTATAESQLESLGSDRDSFGIDSPQFSVPIQDAEEECWQQSLKHTMQRRQFQDSEADRVHILLRGEQCRTPSSAPCGLDRTKRIRSMSPSQTLPAVVTALDRMQAKQKQAKMTEEAERQATVAALRTLARKQQVKNVQNVTSSQFNKSVTMGKIVTWGTGNEEGPAHRQPKGKQMSMMKSRDSTSVPNALPSSPKLLSSLQRLLDAAETLVSWARGLNFDNWNLEYERNALQNLFPEKQAKKPRRTRKLWCMPPSADLFQDKEEDSVASEIRETLTWIYDLNWENWILDWEMPPNSCHPSVTPETSCYPETGISNEPC